MPPAAGVALLDPDDDRQAELFGAGPEWTIASTGPPSLSALFKALTARSEAALASIEWPTMRLKQASLTEQTQRFPCVVGCSVMSVSRS